MSIFLKRQIKRFTLLWLVVGSGGCLLNGQTAHSNFNLQFSGSGQYVELDSTLGRLSFPLTVAVWYKPDASQCGPVRFFCSHDMTGAYQGILFQYIHGYVNLQCGNGTSRSPFGRWGFLSYQSLSPGRWYHLAVVLYSATEAQIYVNGRAVNTVRGGGAGVKVLATDNSLGRIGANYAGNLSYISGELDEFSLWNKALTQQAVRALMCRRLQGQERGLLVYFSFDEGNGKLLTNPQKAWPGGNLFNNPIWVKSSIPLGAGPYCLPAHMTLKYPK